MRLTPFFCALLLCLRVACAKQTDGSIRIGGSKAQNRWKYLSKFGYDIGKGKFQVRLQLQSPKNLRTEGKLKLEVFLDEDWSEVENSENICERHTRARQVRNLTVPPKGEWSEWANGSLGQSIRPHIWYFVLDNCQGSLQNFTHRVRFEFRARQEGGSEFSAEMRGMLLANIVFLAAFTWYIWYFGKKAMQFVKSAGNMHPVMWILFSSVLIHYIAQVFHTMHLLRYRYNGRGLKPLEVLSEMLLMMSQVIQTSLLILIALGYTLLQSRIGELDLILPLCFMVGIIHIMLVGFGKIKDDASYKFHENEGIIGWILLTMRLLLYVWFLWAVQSSANEAGMKLRTFLSLYRGGGSLYFLAYPSIFLFTKCFAPYLQHAVMSIGLMVMQGGSNLWLATLFLTRGEYFRVSTLSDSFLPGGAKVGMVKEE